MPELTYEDLKALAQQQLDRDKITLRQYTVWLMSCQGYSLMGIVTTGRVRGRKTLLHRELQRAKAIMEPIVSQAEEGTIRLGHTIAQGHDTRFANDTTLQRVRKVVVLK